MAIPAVELLTLFAPMRRSAMTLRRLALFVLLCGLCGWTQERREVNSISIDVGWMAAVQRNDGWLVTEVVPRLLIERPPPAPPLLVRKQTLRVGDVLLRIGSYDLAQLGPLAVAWILNDVPGRPLPVHLLRNGSAYDVLVFGEGGSTGVAEPIPKYSPAELQTRDAPAPDFSLADLQGQRHTRDFHRGKWVLLNFWGTWCTACTEEMAGLNYLHANYRGSHQRLGTVTASAFCCANRFLRLCTCMVIGDKPDFPPTTETAKPRMIGTVGVQQHWNFYQFKTSVLCCTLPLSKMILPLSIRRRSKHAIPRDPTYESVHTVVFCADRRSKPALRKS